MEETFVDKRIKILLKKCKAANYRSVLILLGLKGPIQIPALFQLVAKGKKKKFSLLWCAKDSSEERIKKNKVALDAIQRANSSEISDHEKNEFSKYFFCSYNDVQGMLHQAFNMVVMQDIEIISPTLFASVTDCIKGGGVLVILLPKIKKLEDISSLKLAEENCLIGSPRFSQRFISSLTSCHTCCILDDSLNVLKLNLSALNIVDMGSNKEELSEFKAQHQNDPVVESLVTLCHTHDQAKLLLKFLDVLQKRALNSKIAVSSYKGRGKSAALGLAVAGSLALNYSNIFISSLHHDNVKILFRFLLKGLNALSYKEDEDYDLIESVNPKFKNALIGINLFKDHPQAVRFIFPNDVQQKLEQAELVVIDEAAEIPLPLLKQLIGTYTVFMASTTNGYGATGYFLYENTMNSIQQSNFQESSKPLGSSVLPTISVENKLERITLEEPINYAQGDPLENWIYTLFCLESRVISTLSSGCPEPQQCNLYYVCRETLFSNQSNSEEFLQYLMSHFASSKRRLSPEHLLNIADDPNCHIFCLLPPANSNKRSPEILCAVLIHLETKIPSNIVYCGSNQLDSVSPCFMNWETLNEENNIYTDLGIHILDIVTHPHYRRMGYGLRAFQLLQEFYEQKWIPLDDKPLIYPKYTGDATNLPLLLQLSEVQPENVAYFTVSYSLTSDLLRFWKKAGFVPVFVSREIDSAGEHTCFMLKSLEKKFELFLRQNWCCFREYFFVLLRSKYKTFSSSFALSLLRSCIDNQIITKELTKEDIDVYFKPRFMKSLEKYCQSLGEFHCIIPCIPVLAKLYFQNRFKGLDIPFVQQVILLSSGLQHKAVDEISKDLSLPSTQVHGLLNRTIKKLVNYLTNIIEKTVEKSIKAPEVIMEPLLQGLDEELEEAAQKIRKQQLEESKKLMEMDFSQYSIKGSEDDWQKALHAGRKTLVSIKSIKKKPEDVEFLSPKTNSFKAKHKHSKKRR